ncbi:MAG: N-acetylneuraminate synthase [Flavisolibacter sp.]|nr:N-acetylneuraminate synthase [Flavisolibacter sp.]
MEKVLIIAEAGVNHNGSLKLAKQLVDAAAEANVDYVKFQTFKAEKLVSSTAQKAAYQLENTGDKTETQFQMLKKLELSKEDHESLMAYCKSKNIQFFSTAFDLDSLEYLAEIGLNLVKIPSGEITNLPYLQKASRLFKKVILSTGMAKMDEIKEAVDVFIQAGIKRNNMTVLHCNTEYPTPMQDVNLLAMNQIGKELEVAIGYSDHTLGIEVPIAAVALGATIIEKHFTLDRNMEGPDHRASLEPGELKAMVSAIRNIEKTISGTGIKTPSPSELKNIAIARKSIHIAHDVKAGHTLTAEDLMMKRPGIGISPMRLNEVIGRKLMKDLDTDHLLSNEDFSPLA